MGASLQVRLPNGNYRLTFQNPADYDTLEPGDDLELKIGDLRGEVTLVNKSKGREFKLDHTLSELDSQILKAGGKLPWVRTQV